MLTLALNVGALAGQGLVAPVDFIIKRRLESAGTLHHPPQKERSHDNHAETHESMKRGAKHSRVENARGRTGSDIAEARILLIAAPRVPPTAAEKTTVANSMTSGTGSAPPKSLRPSESRMMAAVDSGAAREQPARNLHTGLLIPQFGPET